MEHSLDQIDTAIAARLKALRTLRALTLDDLAGRSGVSRAMISRIERGEASPTAQLLSRLCTALDVTLSSFFAPGGKGADPVSRRAEQPVWKDPETGYQRRAVSPAGTPSRVEVIDVEFPAGARIAYPPETAKEGMTQHLWLFSGRLDMTIGDTTHHLEPGDCLYMSITEGHIFHNPGMEMAHYAVVLDRGRN
ncbi:helix-turn-helix domain-containing protein [Rhizobium sp. ARZ01]|uniref:helix-turn-helix domain-containing protein n=1 Tax=Rhizobium sp. ARZ01 TaxID=2769313 RepID=UPI00177CCCE1|nr:helix-turn-helix domain-containing protein [Rhizobium sp. ARZ01]MBD9374239.1 helix-turn-helix domain-containing protein [Rhizobium sp. ARZ01]